MIIIAIDIGLSGAMARLDVAGRPGVVDLPVVATGLDRWLDGRAIYDQLLDWCPATERALLVVEDVRPRAQGNGGRAMNSMASQGSMMRSRGVVECAAAIARMEITWVRPQRWKAHFALKRDTEDEAIGVTKEKSRQMALSLFPSLAHALARKKDQNRAEALLMAHWGRATQL